MLGQLLIALSSAFDHTAGTAVLASDISQITQERISQATSDKNGSSWESSKADLLQFYGPSCWPSRPDKSGIPRKGRAVFMSNKENHCKEVGNTP